MVNTIRKCRADVAEGAVQEESAGEEVEDPGLAPRVARSTRIVKGVA